MTGEKTGNYLKNKRLFGLDLAFLVKNSFWLNVEKGWRILGELGIIVLLTRLTNLKVVGQFELLVSVYSLVSVLAITGFNSSLTRALSMGYDGTLREVVRLSWRWSLVGVVGLVSGGWWCWANGYPEIGLGLMITAPIFPWYTVLRRWDVVLQAKERFAERSVYYIIVSAALFVGVGAALGWNRQSVIIPFVVLIVVQSVFNIVFFRRVKRLISNNLVEPGWMKSGYKLFMSEIFTVMYSRLDRIVLVAWLGLEALAIYAIATKIGEGLKLVLGGAVSVYLPRLYKQGTINIVQWCQEHLWKYLAVLAVGLAVIWFITPASLSLIFGKDYEESGVYAQWYLLVVPLHLIASVWGYLLIKERREVVFVVIGITAGIANIVAYVLLIPLWGIAGAVAGSIIYYFVLGGLYVGSVYWWLRKATLSNN